MFEFVGSCLNLELEVDGILCVCVCGMCSYFGELNIIVG